MHLVQAGGQSFIIKFSLRANRSAIEEVLEGKVMEGYDVIVLIRPVSCNIKWAYILFEASFR